MDEKRKLIVIEKSDEELTKVSKEQAEQKISHPNQTNPILKKLMNFKNSKIGDKLTVKDLLR